MAAYICEKMSGLTIDPWFVPSKAELSFEAFSAATKLDAATNYPAYVRWFQRFSIACPACGKKIKMTDLVFNTACLICIQDRKKTCCATWGGHARDCAYVKACEECGVPLIGAKNHKQSCQMYPLHHLSTPKAQAQVQNASAAAQVPSEGLPI
jgi:hypothetical protein